MVFQGKTPARLKDPYFSRNNKFFPEVIE